MLSEFFPRGDEGDITGGTEAVAYYISQHLRKFHEVEVFHGPGESVAWSDASLRSVPNRLRFVLSAISKGIRSRSDIVVGTSYVDYAAAWFIALVTRARVVFWYHDVLIGRWTKGGFGKGAGMVGEVIERLLLRLPGVFYIANSHVTAQKLEHHGIKSERISVVHCGVEPSLVDRIPKESPACPTITVVGRLVPYKRVDVVISAFSRLLETLPEARLKIIGQGPQLTALKDQVARAELGSRVNFLGFIDSHADVLRHIASSSLLVTASEVEGFGIILVEAMALGVPVVASDIPAFREVTNDGSSAVIVRAGDVDAMTAAMTKVLTDPELRNSLRKSGVVRAADFSWPVLAQKTSEILSMVGSRTAS